MTEIINPQVFDPLNAPLKRKLLAIRYLVFGIIGLAITLYLVDWIDHSKPDIPRWLEKVIIGFVALQFLAFGAFLINGAIPDLIVHFAPDSRIMQWLIRNRGWSPEAIATEFSKGGYLLPMLPLIVAGIVIGILLVVLLMLGGLALAYSLISAMFSGWPSWAIVIALLLLAIYLKK